MRTRFLILLATLGSFGLSACSGKRLHAGDDGAGGGHAGTGGSQAGRGGGQAGAAAGAGGSVLPSGTGGTTGSGGAGGSGASIGSGGAAGQAGGGVAGGNGLSLDPSSATFAGTLVEAVSATQTFTVRNGGAATTALAALGGTHTADFRITSNGCGATLQPGASCEITLAFAPKTRSGSRSASLTVAAAAGTAANASLSGNALPSIGLIAGAVGGCGYADGTGTGARLYYPVGIAGDGAGNLYVADSYNYAIRKIAIATGAVTTLAGTPRLEGSADGTGAAAGFSKLKAITGDGAGNLYVIDDRAIRKVVAATGTVTTLADLSGVPLRIEGASSIVSDGPGTLYVSDIDTLFGGERSSVRRVAIATGTVTSIADRTGVQVRLSPAGMFADGSGSLYLGDFATVDKVVIATGAVTTIAGAPIQWGSVDGIGAAARFGGASAITSDGAGNLYVTEGTDGAVVSTNVIRKIVIATGAVTTLAGSAGMYGSEDGTGAAARFANPAGIVSDGMGNVYVADTSNCAIRKVAVATGAVTTFAGAAGHESYLDGIGAAARFGIPRGIASDGAGNLYVADNDANAIRKIVLATGAVTTVAGGAKAGNLDGIGAAASFYQPSDVAFDGAGNLFVADRSSNTIRKLVIATRAVTTLAGAADQSQGNADGIGAAARFIEPSGITADGAGNLYVADSGNNAIRKIVIATRAVTTFVGGGGQGSMDGTGAGAQFYWPCWVAGDGAGNLYVADTGNSTVRKVVIATRVVTTLAGVAGQDGSTDGTGAAARFISPGGMALDGAGNLYIADYGTIRKIAIASAVVSTVIGSPGRSGVLLGALPGSLNAAVSVAVLPTGELAIVETLENAILIGHL